MKLFLMMTLALGAATARAQSTFKNFEGTYVVVKQLLATPEHCQSDDNKYPCLRIGDEVKINSSLNGEIVNVIAGEFKRVLKESHSAEEGHYFSEYFTGDGIESAGWQTSSTSSKNRSVGITKFVPGFYKFILIPGIYVWDDTHYEVILERVNE